MFSDITVFLILELEEMSIEAAENDGRLARHPLKHAEREVHAHRKLLLHLDDVIQGHSAAIEVRTPTTTKNSVPLKSYWYSRVCLLIIPDLIF